MPLRIAEKWIWDFWFARDGDDTHVFYLQAPKSLGREELRHRNATVGHARSQDLRNWEVLPDALHPSPFAAFDDLAIWTGSILKHQDTWYFFYTAISRADSGKAQRIGLATSPDLLTWEKYPDNPLIALDPRWYEQAGESSWGDSAWRDPWVFRHPIQNDYHAFICARSNQGQVDGRGVIGHARSTDLLHWETLPPVSQPGDFGMLEVPQLTGIGGRYYLLFCTVETTHSVDWQARTGLKPVTGTHYLVSQDPLGPFHLSTNEFLAGDEQGSLYAGKLVCLSDGKWGFIAWRMFENGEFIGELSDPFPLEVKPDGKLYVIWEG